jgi:pimeloyl-ACP methyl ester carboxylesterase
MRGTRSVNYAHSGDLQIAYGVGPDNGPDLVYVSGWVSHLDMMWENDLQAAFLARLSSFSRLITFDKRGVGLSDGVPLDKLPTLEERMDDVRAVLDAVGSERPFLFGHSEGSVMSALFAATYPHRTAGLVLYGAYAARIPRDDYPWAPSPTDRAAFLQKILDHWPALEDMGTLAPSQADNETFIEDFTKYLRSGASPSAAHALAAMNTQADIRSVLGSIIVPTLLLHRTNDRDADIGGARYMADRIPAARLVELAGADHLPWTEDSDSVVDEIEEFVTGVRPSPTIDRVLATVLFTDIVDSTRVAAELGDAQWRRVIDAHDRISRDHVDRRSGTFVKTTGDGILATFDGPARAVRCAEAIARDVHPLGIAIRSGVHTGEIELRGNDIGGIAVHIAARVIGEAKEAEILTSSTVKDLVAGSGISFTSRGVHTLKGVPGEWTLYAAS